MQAQGFFDSLLGYSLKRDYLGDSLNWRNIETFNLDIQVTDLTNATNVAPDGTNYLSTYILGVVSSLLNYDKHNITIKSIEQSSSTEAAENLIQAAKYTVTAEVRTAIDAVTLLAQHPELNESVGSAESGKFYGVGDVLTTYAEEIDAISESFTFDDKEEGKKSFNHSVDLTVRTSSTQSAKLIAQTIATHLFDEDVNNTYFGHNAFTGALQNYGHTTNNKHYFEESYDLKKNKFSFTKKMEVLDLIDATDAPGPSGTGEYTGNLKYSIDIAKDGRVNISETMEIKSRDGSYDNIKIDIDAEIALAYTRCSNVLASYNVTIDGRGTNAVAATISSIPLTKTIIYDEQGLKATISTSFSNDVQGPSSQFLETVDLNRDHKGVVTATYNVTLTSHREKTLNADSDIWASGNTPLDILKVYETNSLTRICDIVHFTNQAGTVKGVFWNTLSWWWPYGSGGTVQLAVTESACNFHPVTLSVSSQDMGKTFTLTKTFSNDAIYHFGGTNTLGSSTANFTKVEIKYNDTWPKRTVNEHTVIDRGTSPITANIPKTSVMSDAQVTQPGKRSVTINAVEYRQPTSLLSTPRVPVAALTALAREAKYTLLDVFPNDKIKDSYQSIAYISNLSYTYDSENNLTLTAELTYTYKRPPPFEVGAVLTIP